MALKLVSERMKFDAIVIDRINRPTGNQPDSFNALTVAP